MELEGKVAVVTGGGRGLGKATALALAEKGARVVVLARTLPEVEETARIIRSDYGVGRSLAVRADVRNEREVHDAFESVRRRWGGTDILVNNAGDAGATRPVATLSLEEWQRTLDVHLTGAFLCSREAIHDMSRKRWGRIINVSSGSASAAVPSMAPYSVAKAALEHLTRILAAEGASMGIVALAVRPGVIDTRMQEELRGRPPEQMPPELRAAFAAYKQRGLLVSPERPAEIIAYLCGERSAGLNGRILEEHDMEALLVR
jgi:NAD(P)-dependent dehydrogenase (short-subunit alcohol dehydrogenase family)